MLRDDGLGMTKDDFITRWLTLGTESKLTNRKTTLPPIDESKSLRITMGEKGIGRLAIASIGKQVLILSKAIRKEKQHKIIAALINLDERRREEENEKSLWFILMINGCDTQR